MKIQIFDKAKKKRFLAELESFGVGRIFGMLVRVGRERIRAFSGDLSREEIMELWRLFPIEGIGLYVAKDFVNRNGVHEVRLSVDALHVLDLKSGKRVVELDGEQEKKWFAGEDIELSEAQIGVWELGVSESGIDKGFVLVRSGGDFVGMGKIGNGVLYNFLPKERRRRASQGGRW